MIAGLKQSPLWQALRGVKRRLQAPRHDVPLPPANCRAKLAWLEPPAALEGGQTFPAQFRIENLSSEPWSPLGIHPVKLCCEWFTYSGARFADGPHAEIPLPFPIYPGEPQVINATLQAPAFVGDFVLHTDLIQSELFTDSNPESVAVRTPVPVMGSRATDIDYHAVYRAANLADNHWWVVGIFPTKEAYDRSSRERLQMLIQNGLTPESRILDVGCGTGQMAGVLMPYLSDRGAYCGTDIGREAIDYCNANFQRRNFHFRVGGMTSVPFTENQSFDLAIFFSVFTHTFTDESALLLAESARLLKPDGVVIADIIVSKLVERCAGHRGEMIVNREHFLKLAAMVGFTGEVLGRWDWNRHAERLMFRFRRS